MLTMVPAVLPLSMSAPLVAFEMMRSFAKKREARLNIMPMVDPVMDPFRNVVLREFTTIMPVDWVALIRIV